MSDRPLVFITGAGGFIGSALYSGLASDFSVQGTVRRSPGDLLVHDWTRPFTQRLPRTPDFLIHALFQAPDQDAAAAFRNNELAAKNVAQFACAAAVRRVFLLSTGSVYAEATEGLHEKSKLAPKGDAYAASTLRVEEIFARAGRPLTRLRLFYPYGRGQSRARLVSRLAERIRTGQPVDLNNEAGQPRINPIYITDLVTAVQKLLLAEAAQSEDEIVNIAGPTGLTIRELCEKIARDLGKECQFQVKSAQNVSNRFAPPEHLYQLTGFRPQIGIEEGLTLALAGRG